MVTAKERVNDSSFNNMVAGHQGCAEEAGRADGGVAAHPDPEVPGHLPRACFLRCCQVSFNTLPSYLVLAILPWPNLVLSDKVYACQNCHSLAATANVSNIASGSDPWQSFVLSLVKHAVLLRTRQGLPHD